MASPNGVSSMAGPIVRIPFAPRGSQRQADFTSAIVGCSRAFSSCGTPEGTLTYIKFFVGAAVTLAGAVTCAPPEDSKSRRKGLSISSV